MKFDFTTLPDRHGMDAIAVDPPAGSEYRKGITVRDGLDHIPMWVADMNFKTVPTIPEALMKRSAHPLYGYFEPRTEYFDAIIRWHAVRKGADDLAPELIGYENSVLGGVVSALHALASPGDGILVHSPTYIGFTKVMENNGYRAVLSPLYRDQDGVWRMDYEDMEKKLSANPIHCAIFCSPHNPSGRVWEAWEIEKAMEIYRKHDVYVISDEIWSDILLDGHRHIPTQSISGDAKRRTAAFYAPSKTFNLAGLVGSYHVIYDRWLRDRVRKEGSLSHYNCMNVLSMYALIGAYSPEGEQWTDELCSVLSGNVSWAVDHIRKNWPGVELAKPEGTYLLYPDCTGWCEAHGITINDLRRAGFEAGVDWQDGRPFLNENTIRMNLALPRARMEEAFARLDRYVFV